MRNTPKPKRDSSKSFVRLFKSLIRTPRLSDHRIGTVAPFLQKPLSQQERQCLHVTTLSQKQQTPGYSILSTVAVAVAAVLVSFH